MELKECEDREDCEDYERDGKDACECCPLDDIIEEERKAENLETNVMKVGDRVTMYEDPITERIIEGLATLKEKCSTPDLELDDGSHLEHWIVKFDGDDAGQFYRKIKV